MTADDEDATIVSKGVSIGPDIEMVLSGAEVSAVSKSTSEDGEGGSMLSDDSYTMLTDGVAVTVSVAIEVVVIVAVDVIMTDETALFN